MTQELLGESPISRYSLSNNWNSTWDLRTGPMAVKSKGKWLTRTDGRARRHTPHSRKQKP